MSARGLGADEETAGAVDLELEREVRELRADLRQRLAMRDAPQAPQRNLTEDAEGALDDAAFALSLFEDSADAVQVLRAATATITAMYFAQGTER